MKKVKIAVIDDNVDARNFVTSAIEDAITNLDIGSEWSVLKSSPFPKLKDYTEWVNKEQVGVLVVDERLGEVPDSDGQTANYKGSDLVGVLRKQFKDMPIYGVTSHPADPSLKEHFALFDEVVERDIFMSKAGQYVERFLRTYKNFLDLNEKELTELSIISKKIALGTANTVLRKRAEAIQQNLEIPVVTTALNSRKEWLDEYEKLIGKFKETQKGVNKFLKQKPKKKKK